MGVLKYRCPVTDTEVDTDISANQDTLEKMRGMRLSLWCPFCSMPHQVPLIDAYIDRDPSIRLPRELGDAAKEKSSRRHRPDTKTN